MWCGGSGSSKARSWVCALVGVVAGCGRAEHGILPGPMTAEGGSSTAGSSPTATGGSHAAGGVAAGSGGSGGIDIDPGFCCQLSPENRAGGPSFGTLHRCTEFIYDEECPSQVLNDNVLAEHPGDLAVLEGVTELDGDLVIKDATGVDALHCLNTIAGSLTVELSAEQDTALWALRNLQRLDGSVTLSSSPGRIYSDCAFTAMRSFGGDGPDAGAFRAKIGVAGELDLSALTVHYLQVQDTGLDDLSLPNVGAGVTSFVLKDNPYLSFLRGWQGLSVLRSEERDPSLKYPVEVSGNPYIQSCDAEDMVEPFYAAGFARDEVVVQNNGPCLRHMR